MPTSPGRYTLNIYKGMDLDLTFTYRDTAGALVNLTGYTARMKVRASDGSFPVSLTDGGAANGITLGAGAGTIRVQRTAAQTAAYSFSRGVYDLELEVTATGIVTRLLEGDVIAHAEVTT